MKQPIHLFILIAAFTFSVPYAQTLKPVPNPPDQLASDFAAISDNGNTIVVLESTNNFGVNSKHHWQLVSYDSTTGNGSAVTDFNDTLHLSEISISDDGQWIAFTSSANPLGSNHDESVELFVINANGTGLTQLTNTAGIDIPEVGPVFISGDGSRIAFGSKNDPLGTDPSNLGKIYVIDRDGSNLEEVLSVEPFSLMLNDTATKVSFTSNYDPFGTNTDGSTEGFVVNIDGTGLRQATDAASMFRIFDFKLSGDGSQLTWTGRYDPLGTNPDEHYQIYTDTWSGGALVELTSGDGLKLSPSITDDGSVIVFEANMDAGVNPEGNYEIWTVQSDGTGLTAITSTSATSNRNPFFSGDGAKIAFQADGEEHPNSTNPDGGDEWFVMDAAGTNITQLTSLMPDPDDWEGASVQLTPDGSRLVFLNGRYDGGYLQVVNIDGTNLQTLAGPLGHTQALSSNDSTVVFSSLWDPLGQNFSMSYQVFAVELDGTGLRQLSDGTGFGTQPAIASNNSWVVYQGPGGLVQVKPDGSQSSVSSLDTDSLYKWPAISGNGDWATYHSQDTGDVLVYRTTTSAPTRVVVAMGLNGDVADDGTVVYEDDATGDCYLWQQFVGASAISSGGGCTRPKITDDGSVVFYNLAPELFDGTAPSFQRTYRYEVDTGLTERLGGVATRAAVAAQGSFEELEGVSFRTDGRLIHYFGRLSMGDWTGTLPRGEGGYMLVDLDEPNPIKVSATHPTVVSWFADPKFRRYDIIRGDVANLNGGAQNPDLGPVVCIENDSPDPDTVGDEDNEVPAPGQVFFYVYRGTQGASDGPGSYGVSSGGQERLPSSGDCGS